MTTVKLLTAKLASLEKKCEICVEELMSLQVCTCTSICRHYMYMYLSSLHTCTCI